MILSGFLFVSSLKPKVYEKKALKPRYLISISYLMLKDIISSLLFLNAK